MMSTMAADPVLQALMRSATQASGAELGVLLRHDGEVLRVVATDGERAHVVSGATVPVHAGIAGYVLASGQPIALSVKPGDPRLSDGVIALLPVPPSTALCVPCTTDEDSVGALLLLDKAGGQFTFDDVELATLLAGIAGAALAGGDAGRSRVPDPGELGGDLSRLAAADPARYAMVATLVQALLARG